MPSDPSPGTSRWALILWRWKLLGKRALGGLFRHCSARSRHFWSTVGLGSSWGFGGLRNTFIASFKNKRSPSLCWPFVWQGGISLSSKCSAKIQNYGTLSGFSNRLQGRDSELWCTVAGWEFQLCCLLYSSLSCLILSGGMVFAMILCGWKGNSSAHLSSCFKISMKELRMLQALTPQACGHSGPQESRSLASLSLPPPSSFPQRSPPSLQRWQMALMSGQFFSEMSEE